MRGDQRMMPAGRKAGIAPKRKGTGVHPQQEDDHSPVVSARGPGEALSFLTGPFWQKMGSPVGRSRDSPIGGKCSLGTEYEHEPLLLRCRDFFQISHSGVCVAEGGSFLCGGGKRQESGEEWFASCLCVDICKSLVIRRSIC